MDSAIRFAPFWQDFSRSEIGGSGQRPSLLYVPSFIGGAREKEEEKGGSSGTRGGIRCFYEFTLSLFRPPPPSLSLFLPAQVELKYLKHAHGLWLSLTRRPPPHFPLSLLLFFSLLLIFISRPLFFFSFPFGNISRSRIHR